MDTTLTLRISWLYQRFMRSIRIAYRTPKWWYQRATKGYSDRDMWNADMYLAKKISQVLNHLVDHSHGIPMSYATDREDCDVDEMQDLRDYDYLYHAHVFEEYSKNGVAFDEKWKHEFGGVLEEDLKASIQWLSEHFTELWD